VWSYALFLIFFSTLQLIVEMGVIGVSVALVQLILYNPHTLYLPTLSEAESPAAWYALIGSILVGAVTLFGFVVSVVYLIAALAAKWIMLGKTDMETKHPLRGYYHAAWVFNLHMMYRVNGIIGPLKETALFAAIFRLYGAKVGKNVRFCGIGALFPEAECYDIKDGAFIACAAYGHNFLRGHLRFEKCHIGESVLIANSGSQIVPGTSFADGMVVSPGLNLVK
jgi:hypothetical protein